MTVTTRSGQPGDARHAAALIVREHLESGAFPDRLIEGISEQRAAVVELVYGVMRQRRALRWILDTLVPRHPGTGLQAALLVGLYQVLFMSEADEYAAVNETVSVAKSMTNQQGANLVNAVLRRAQREKDKLLQQLARQPAAVRLSHPDLLVSRWARRFGEQPAEALCAWNNTRAQVVLRLRTDLVKIADYAESLRRLGFRAEPHPYAPRQALILARGARVAELPGYAEGWFVVQDPSTFLAVALLDPHPGERILDACSAPGGKTALIADALRGEGTLIVMDLHNNRIARLRENLDRLRLPGVRVVRGDAAAMDQVAELRAAEPFDGILLDVPCTNTGVIRRRPDARWRFSLQRLRRLNRTQRAILDAAAARVKPGGRIVYSTCSLEPEENEDMVAAWIKAHPSFRCTQSQLLFPPESQTDGAFAARLESSSAG